MQSSVLTQRQCGTAQRFGNANFLKWPIISFRQQLRPSYPVAACRSATEPTVTARACNALGRICKGALLSAASAAVVLSGLPDMALANEKVGEFAASGFVFKDSVDVIAIEDPSVQGVTIYISDFQRSITDKLAKDFFNEPSQASVTCALTGKLAFDEQAIAGREGQEVFSERKGLNFLQNKTLRVRRVWDPEHKTLLYVAYSTHLTGGHDNDAGRYKTSVCAIPLAGNSDFVPNAQ